MVRCDECLRANPPTRFNCLYCGQTLPLNDAAGASVKPSLRPLERWEQGYNNILLRLRNGAPADELRNQIAGFLRLEPTGLGQLFSADRALPLARAATREEATLVERKLNELGIETVIVSDAEDLQIEASPPRRVRRLQLRETDLVMHQTADTEGTLIAWGEITFLVPGRLFVKRQELREKRSRKAENEILEASEMGSDEAIVDIYTAKHEGSWRITASGFDFSCLGPGKALLALENFSTLITRIREQAPNAVFDDSYFAQRHRLDLVWPLEKRTEPGGVRIGKLKRTMVEIITTNNEAQFTRYSRLCHYLKSHSLVQP
jgi:hypothetical protein